MERTSRERERRPQKRPPEKQGGLSSAGCRFAIVASRFNAVVVDRLLEGAIAALEGSGSRPGEVEVVRVPGAFEMPLAASRLAESERFDAVIALGCVIRGETPHFEYVSRSAADGLQRVALDTGVPVGFGVLTVDTMEQALARAGGESGNRGADAALAAIEMVHVLRGSEGD